MPHILKKGDKAPLFTLKNARSKPVGPSECEERGL